MLNQSGTSESKLCAAISNNNDLSPSTESIIDFHTPLNKLFTKLSGNNDDNILIKNGYKKIDTICDTLQGELFKGKQISNDRFVVIKRTNKGLYKQKVAIQDGTSFCVLEDIVKEASILKYLSIDNQCLGEYIIEYIDFFESDTDYYLVMEYIESEINLKEFVIECHKYIKNGKLKLKEYQKMIKYIYWQIAVTVCWLHRDMKCCHLDLCLENIMLQNCSLMQESDGYLVINPKISIKLCDFGVAEIFNDSFVCGKHCLSLDNVPYLAPKVFAEEIYDARLADTWSLGMILYECMTGKPLYKPIEIIWQSTLSESYLNGYTALHQGRLSQYISIKHGFKYFNSVSFELLLNLLNINQQKRFHAINVLKHKWFTAYYKNYAQRIEHLSIAQKQKTLKEKEKMMHFPYYRHLSEY